MFRKIFIASFIFLFLLCLQSIVSNTAQTQQVQKTEQANSEVQPFINITLEISTPSQSVMPLQPIPIVIKQSNKTTKPVLGYESVGFNETPINLFVRKSGTNEKVEFGTLTGISKYKLFKNFPVAPGVSYESKEWIALGLNKYVPEPGNYELQAVLPSADMTQEIESNILNIVIQEPNGVDRDVYNLVKNSPVPETLFSDLDFDKGKIILETIANRFPDSAYARSAYYMLGKVYLSRGLHQKALINLIKLENDKDFIHAEKVKDYLTQIRQAVQTNQLK